MNLRTSVLYAAFGLVLSPQIYAQASTPAPATTDAGQQQTQNRAGSEQKNQKRQIDQQHRAALEKCKSLKENAKDICEAEADGQKKVAEAQAKVAEHDSPKNRLNLEKAKADAEYNVAKERCDDQVGDAKSACKKQAKATHDSAVAQAQAESQKQSPQ